MQNAPGKAWNGMEDKECCDEKAYVTGSDAPCALFRKLNPRPTERPPFLGFRTLPVEIANAHDTGDRARLGDGKRRILLLLQNIPCREQGGLGLE